MVPAAGAPRSASHVSTVGSEQQTRAVINSAFNTMANQISSENAARMRAEAQLGQSQQEAREARDLALLMQQQMMMLAQNFEQERSQWTARMAEVEKIKEAEGDTQERVEKMKKDREAEISSRRLPGRL